jgi:hypothetical protein
LWLNRASYDRLSLNPNVTAKARNWPISDDPAGGPILG